MLTLEREVSGVREIVDRDKAVLEGLREENFVLKGDLEGRMRVVREMELGDEGWREVEGRRVGLVGEGRGGGRLEIWRSGIECWSGGIVI